MVKFRLQRVLRAASSQLERPLELVRRVGAAGTAFRHAIGAQGAVGDLSSAEVSAGFAGEVGVRKQGVAR